MNERLKELEKRIKVMKAIEKETGIEVELLIGTKIEGCENVKGREKERKLYRNEV